MLVAQSTLAHRPGRTTPVMPRATIIAVEADFDFRSAHFLRLFQNSAATAFQHPLWLDAFYRTIVVSRGAEKLVVTGRDAETGALRLVMPFMRRRTNGMTVIETADLGASDYAAPVVAHDWIAPARIRDDIAAVLPNHDLLRIRPVRADMVEAWRDFIDGDSHTMQFFGPATDLSGPFPQWRSGAVGETFRKHVDTNASRPLKCGATAMRLLRDSAEIAHAIEAIRASRQDRFEVDPIQDKPVRDFYTSLAIAGGCAGFAHIYAIMEKDKAVGHILAINWKRQFHYLLVGCDFERHGSHTTGLMLHDAMVEDWIRDDGAAFNFSIGDEAFRQEPGNNAAETFVFTRATTWRGRLARAALDANDHVEQMQRRTFIG